MKISIELYEWNNFITTWKSDEWQRHLRYGQAFYNYFNLFKMKQTPDLEKLYNTRNDMEARDLIDCMFEIH